MIKQNDTYYLNIYKKLDENKILDGIEKTIYFKLGTNPKIEESRKKLDNYILLDNNFNEIVRSKNQIFILNDKKVIVENHLIDLNSEYINFRYVYELHIMCNNKNLKFSFNNIRDLNEYIEENSRKIDNLNSKLECYNNEIQNIGNEEVDHIKKYLKQ